MRTIPAALATPLLAAPASGERFSRIIGGLTAAHCSDDEDDVRDVLPENLEILVGLEELGRSGVRFDVAEIAIHPDFVATSTDLDSDIALVRLAASPRRPGSSWRMRRSRPRSSRARRRR